MNRIRISALITFSALGVLAQQSAEPHLSAGKHLFESGNYPDAVKELSAAETANPMAPGVRSLLGRALLNTGDSDGAASEFRSALQSDPNDFEANLHLGQILVEQNDAASALPYAKRALAIRPSSAEAKLANAGVLAALGKFTDARPLAESASALLPNSPEAHQTLAVVYKGLHLETEAEGERALAAALMPPDPGPKPGEPAPDFSVLEANSDKTVRLSDFRGKSPVVLVFGSYSCPTFRWSATSMRELYGTYGSRIPFYTVYIREAHAQNQWQSGRNVRDGINIEAVRTINDKQQHATMCSRQLHLPFPALVDGLDGKAEAAYNAWPSRAYVVGRDGKILYQTRLTQLDFHPEEMAATLRKIAQ